MLFDCPHCQHGNEVPEAELTGLAVTIECGRCHAKFRVVPEDTAEEAPVLELPLDEQTAVGNTMPEVLGAAEGGAIPSETDFEESDSRTLGEADLEPKTMPIETAEADLRRSVTTDASTLNVERPPSSIELSSVGAEQEPEGAKTILQGPSGERARTEKPARRIEARRPAREEPQVTVTPAKSNSDVYSRIAHGEGVSVIPVPKARERPSTKAWNEPSAVHAVTESRSGLRAFITMMVAHLERAPLFIRVWLAVFPLALGLILLLSRRAPEESVPIAIPAQATSEPDRLRAVKATPEPTPPARASDPAPEPPEPSPETPEPPTSESELSNAAEAPSLGFDDPEAPPGSAFIKLEGVRLRSGVGAKGKPFAPVSPGTLVKQYDEVEDWVLIMVPPRGPVGFVKKSALDTRKPLSVLSKELAFLGCTAVGSSVTSCIDDAERQLEACSSGCNQVERCEQACRMAEQACMDGCRKR